jgi:hypothetical protein
MDDAPASTSGLVGLERARVRDIILPARSAFGRTEVDFLRQVHAEADQLTSALVDAGTEMSETDMEGVVGSLPLLRSFLDAADGGGIYFRRSHVGRVTHVTRAEKNGVVLYQARVLSEDAAALVPLGDVLSPPETAEERNRRWSEMPVDELEAEFHAIANGPRPAPLMERQRPAPPRPVSPRTRAREDDIIARAMMGL